MSLRNTTDNAKTTLSGAITNSQTTLSVVSGAGAKFPASNFIFVVYDADGSNYEKILCTTRSTDSMTSLVRGYGGTTAVAHASGSIVELPITTEMITDIDAELFKKFILKENITGGLPVKVINDGGVAKIEKLLGSQYKTAGTEVTVNADVIAPSMMDKVNTTYYTVFKVLNEFYAYYTVFKNVGTFVTLSLVSYDLVNKKIIDEIIIFTGEPTTIGYEGVVFGFTSISGSGKTISANINVVYSAYNKGLRGMRIISKYGMLNGMYYDTASLTTSGTYVLYDMEGEKFTYYKIATSTYVLNRYLNNSFGTELDIAISGNRIVIRRFTNGSTLLFRDVSATFKLYDSSDTVLSSSCTFIPASSTQTHHSLCTAGNGLFTAYHHPDTNYLVLVCFIWNGGSFVQTAEYNVISGLTGTASNKRQILFSYDSNTICIIYSPDGSTTKAVIVNSGGTILSPIYTLPFYLTESDLTYAAVNVFGKNLWHFLNSRRFIYSKLANTEALYYVSPDDRDEFLGIIQATATTGNSEVVRMKGWISSGHSGLTFPADYYISESGTLTTTVTPYKIGRSISATEIKLD